MRSLGRWSADVTDDPLGRVTPQTVHNGSALLKTSWTRDKPGLPTAKTDPNGNVTGYSYDETGRQAVTVAPTVHTSGPWCDARNRPASPEGQMT
jgi:YD repeat-containing protein